jgi:DNA mismatch repair protein MutS
MDIQFTTPMMKQYEVIKKQYKDCLLFYRMGDFYELFLEDAHIGSKVLDITLTSRSKGRDGKIPMAGVPYHAVDSYITKLVKNGYKVAICEQMSEPSSRGIVDREVIRVVTPGTVLDEKALNQKENNYIASILFRDNQMGFAACDISTGSFFVHALQGKYKKQLVNDELSRINPVEIIVSDTDYNDPEVLKILHAEQEVNISCFHTWDSYAKEAEKFLKNHFKLTTLESFGLTRGGIELEAAAALLGYVKETQKDKIGHIRTIQTTDDYSFVHMDRATMINLELFSTIRDHDNKGSLLSVLDKTKTPMGGRLLRSWIKKPLLNKQEIESRYDATGEFTKNTQMRSACMEILSDINDTERTLARLSVGIGNARDLTNIKSSLERMEKVKQIIFSSTTPLLQSCAENISDTLQEIIEKIGRTIIEEPPVSTKDGGMIRPGINKELDDLRSLVGGGKEWISKLEIAERSRTGINSLKVRYNKVFGFYIEVSHANTHLVPDDYFRKQTLVNGERYITPDLKKQEEIIVTAEGAIKDIEYKIFMDMLKDLLLHTEDIQRAAQATATIDCLVNFATLAIEHSYVRPKILYSQELRIKEGRHPVVEQLENDTRFVPNDVTLDPVNQQLLIITGPNMAGKSVFIRQVALIVLLAQIGCFVPASQAHISLVDRIFVRSGASDVITSGLSTFMVEMVETAYILNHATKNSLIIMDEIGRGTSTYDGISIAWAVAEYLVTHEKTPAKTLFATHYHELQELEKRYPHKIRNYHMAVIEEAGMPIFLHTILPGGASASFGVAVARLAGVPEVVIKRAEALLSDLEKKHVQAPVTNEEKTRKVSVVKDDILKTELNTIDISRMTPLDALNTLAALQEKAKN